MQISAQFLFVVAPVALSRRINNAWQRVWRTKMETIIFRSEGKLALQPKGGSMLTTRSGVSWIQTLLFALSAILLGGEASADIPPLVSGDEPIVVTTHQIKTATGPLKYEAHAGRLAIRNDESGEIRGYI